MAAAWKRPRTWLWNMLQHVVMSQVHFKNCKISRTQQQYCKELASESKVKHQRKNILSKIFFPPGVWSPNLVWVSGLGGSKGIWIWSPHNRIPHQSTIESGSMHQIWHQDQPKSFIIENFVLRKKVVGNITGNARELVLIRNQQINKSLSIQFDIIL